MIHAGDFPVTSRRLPRNIPVTRVMGKFWEVGVMEFGLKAPYGTPFSQPDYVQAVQTPTQAQVAGPL